ncbi:hypothetical protein C7964_104143 [Loktanella sp. PT4BL]|jgi:hypothetical protein|uniref:hypothetical protein n=1 Tax=Loktanella sp. PT4BL TaxID=2135611 RepID=UPI000D76AD0C|nr:hypothetical protein [Loktanella sp. PT4BL]PXW68053.1 hypothetical protein C7964_104143 [Loktanella sp. PT4BL]
MGNKNPETATTLTPNELAWISFLRELTNDRVPRPTLHAVQALRLGLSGQKIRLCDDGSPDNSISFWSAKQVPDSR